MLHAEELFPHTHFTQTHTVTFDIREDLNGDGFSQDDPIADYVSILLTDIQLHQHGPPNPRRLPDMQIRAGDSVSFAQDCYATSDDTQCAGTGYTFQYVSTVPAIFYPAPHQVCYSHDENHASPLPCSIEPERVWEQVINRYVQADIEVFIDNNANGVRDSDETTGVVGFQELSDAGTLSKYIAPADEYQYTPDLPRYEGTTRPRYVITTLHRPQELQSGDTYHEEIGVFEYATARGMVFYDSNGNGIQDAGEEPVQGATVFFDRNVGGVHDGQRNGTFNQCGSTLWDGEVCTSTNDDGFFELPGGIYDDQVTILSPGQARRLYPTVQDTIRVDESGQVIDGLKIGVARGVNISGRVYRDLLENGSYDHKVDVPLDGGHGAFVLIDVDNDGTINGDVPTQDEGIYFIPQLYPGTHRIIPAVSNGEDITQPSPGGYIITLPADETTMYLDFGVSADAELLHPSEIDIVKPHDGRESEVLQARKRSLREAILVQITQVGDEVWQGRGQDLLDFVNQAISQDPSDGYIPVSLEVLERLDKIVDLQLAFVTQGSEFDDFFDFTLADLDRLRELTGNATDSAWRIITDPDYRRELTDRGFDVALAVTDAVYRELSAFWEDIRENKTRFAMAVIEIAIEDLGSAETYKKLAYDLLAIESFTKAFDPNVPVEARIGNLLAGYAQVIDTVTAGTALGGAAKAKLVLLDKRVRLSVHKAALEMFDDPDMAQTFLGQVTARLERLRAGQVAGLKDLAHGDLVPFEILSEMGYTRKQVDALRKIAVGDPKAMPPIPPYQMRFRTTNTKSAQFIKNGTGVEKPLDIKAKTINDLDVYLGYDPADQGLVGMRPPEKLINPYATEPCLRQLLELCDAITNRFISRRNEYEKLAPKLDANKFTIDDQGRVIDLDRDSRPVAGDIDPVSFQRADGTYVTGADYDRLVEDLEISNAHIQHGAETNVVDDIMRNSKYEVGSPEWNQQREGAIKLQHTLEQNHLSGKEIVIEFGPDGSVRKVNLDRLPQVDSLGRVDGVVQVSTRPLIPVKQLRRLVGGSGMSAEQAAVKGASRLLDEFAASLTTVGQRGGKFLRRGFPEVSFTPSEFSSFTAEQFLLVVHDEPDGVTINSPEPTDGAEGEDSTAITAAMILDKLREAVGEAGLSDFSVVSNAGGSFTVISQQASNTAHDVNGDGATSPLDVLIIINQVNAVGTQELDIWPSGQELRKDINLDGYVSPIDALLIINHLNKRSIPQAEGEFVSHGQRVMPVPDAVDKLMTDGPSWQDNDPEQTDALGLDIVHATNPRNDDRITHTSQPRQAISTVSAIAELDLLLPLGALDSDPISDLAASSDSPAENHA